MTTGGFGKTAWIICASWETVTRISSYRAASVGSDFGEGCIGSGREAQLHK